MDSQRISGRGMIVAESAPTRSTGSQEVERISRVTGSEEQRSSRVTGAQKKRVTGSGPVHTLRARAMRRRILLGIGAGVLVLGAGLLLVLWGAWSDRYEPDSQVAVRRSGAVAAAGPAAPAESATSARVPARRRASAGTASPLVPAGLPAGPGGDSAAADPLAGGAPDAGTLVHAQGRDDRQVPSAAGAATRTENAPDVGSVARVQPRDGGLTPSAEARRAQSLASSKAADGRSPRGSGDAGVVVPASSPDGGRAAPAPRHDDPRPFQADDYRGGRVNVERFAATAGPTVRGQIVDFDTGRPLAGAPVEAIYGDQFIEVVSDASGNFEIPGMVPASHVVIWAGGRRQQWVAERIDVNIPATGKKADLGVIKLLHGNEPDSRLDGWIGTFVAGHRGQVKVSAINAWVPAYNAGIEVGDTILSVDGRDVRGLGPRAVGFLLRGPSGSSTTLEVESSGGKRRKLTLERVTR